MKYVEGDSSGQYFTGSRINCTRIIGNYYYFGSDGRIAGVNINVLRGLATGADLSMDGYNEHTSDDRVLWISTGANIHAIAGYAAS